MTLKCPQCGTPLAVSLALETDFSKTKEILAQKASGAAADLTNEQLTALKWKPSQKKAALSTILVNESNLGVPILKLLYDRLKSSANFAWKIGETTYKLSRASDGSAEWIQKWTAVKSENA